MELELQTHQWRRRLPDWPAAVCAGLVGGAVLMVLELLWSTSVSGVSPWHISHLVAAITMGPETLWTDAFSIGVVAVALTTHYVLGIVFGVILAFIIDGFHYESSAGMQQVLGLAFGAALYLINLYGMAALFPWFEELRGWATFIGHLVFGLTVALAYPALERRRAD